MKTLLKTFKKGYNFETHKIEYYTLEVYEALWLTRFLYDGEWIKTKEDLRDELQYIELRSKQNLRNNEYNYFLNSTIYEYKNFRINKASIDWKLVYYSELIQNLI